jgi:adenine-specific DNA-methyltransferase
MNKIKNLGQVFTPNEIVKKMISYSKNNGRILEPSSGDGAFTEEIKKLLDRDFLAIEFDESYSNEDNIIMDFFDLPSEEKFETIIGNPPYVAFKNIINSTINKIQKNPSLSILDNRANLFLFFVKKCLDHLTDNGEIIFITPREFIKLTSSIKINNILYELGTITDWYEYGDDRLFKGFSPNVVIWRFEKNNFFRETNTNTGIKNFEVREGQIFFTKLDYNIKFNDIFFVKVGAVSGCDKIFTNHNGNEDFVCSYTKKTGLTKKMFYNIFNEFLFKFKDQLINRKIKKFDDSNWWKWGRGFYETNSERIYVNCKTRDMQPFFTHMCKNYDGSVLAIFPKYNINISKAVQMMNSVNWEELGFKVGGRLCFSQQSLENILLPNEFSIFLNPES